MRCRLIPDSVLDRKERLEVRVTQAAGCWWLQCLADVVCLLKDAVVGDWSDAGATPLTRLPWVGPVVKLLSDAASDPFCFSAIAVDGLSSIDDIFASRLFNLAGAFAWEGLGPAGALGVFELLGSTLSTSVLMFSCTSPQFFWKVDSLFL